MDNFANNYILYPYLALFWNNAPVLEIPPDMWGLLKIELWGCVVGHSGEKFFEVAPILAHAVKEKS